MVVCAEPFLLHTSSADLIYSKKLNLIFRLCLILVEHKMFHFQGPQMILFFQQADLNALVHARVTLLLTKCRIIRVLSVVNHFDLSNVLPTASNDKENGAQ